VVRVRLALSPTGSGAVVSAAVARLTSAGQRGEAVLLATDRTDPVRSRPGGSGETVRELGRLGVRKAAGLRTLAAPLPRAAALRGIDAAV
jgi:hypothetical protein